MKNILKKVAEIQTLIDQATKDDIMAIEVDSTWESGYQFKTIEVMKTKIKLHYHEFNGSWEEKVDSYKLSDMDDVKYMLSWIRRCIKKGYKQANLEQIKQTKEDNQ